MRFCITAALFGASAAQLLTYPWVDIPFPGKSSGESTRPVSTQRFEKGTLTISEDSTLCDPAVKQYSGYFTITGTNKKYFYWFFESRASPSESSPTVAWLTGGPGCSSMLALFGENGPCTVTKDGTGTTPNPYSWNTVANMLWIDQPAGTGFSEGDYDSGEAEVADDMLGFLLALFEALPQYNKKFYIFGESYAGHYIPAIAHKVYEHNKSARDKLIIDFQGVGIGNGLTSPEEQYKWYPEMAFNSTTAPPVVSEKEYREMEESVDTCSGLIKLCNAYEAAVGETEKSSTSNPMCLAAMVYCNMKLMVPYQNHGMNPYDMRIKCESPPLCYDFSEIGTFLDNPTVRRAIGVDPGAPSWDSCSKTVNLQFINDFMKNYDSLIPDLLEAKIPVLIYVGDQDFICNWIGNKHWVLDLDWSGQKEMNAAADLQFTSDSTGEAIGKLRMAKDVFYFLQVYNAGHMVPMDQPEHALYMFSQFLKFGGKPTFAREAKTEEETTQDVSIESE